jgi:mannose/fructose-specific phosphotransferase system component IIA
MRTGIVIVSHGESGQAMLDVAQIYAGALETKIVTVPIGEVRELTAQRIEAACAAMATDEVLFLVDLEGATPFNVCQKRVGTAVILSGINLPMLFKLATVDRDRGALELAEELKATGQKSIHIRAVGRGQE